MTVFGWRQVTQLVRFPLFASAGTPTLQAMKAITVPKTRKAKGTAGKTGNREKDIKRASSILYLL